MMWYCRRKVEIIVSQLLGSASIFPRLLVVHRHYTHDHVVVVNV